ncbi:hypothetical protein ACROYT_G024599 [Oculina patagonica]
MVAKHLRENYCYWIYIIVVYTPTVVQTLSKCTKVDVCKCSTDEGTIDLTSLAATGSDVPRFKNVTVKGGEKLHLKVSWNPCNKWSQADIPGVTQKNTCTDIAVCYNVARFVLADIGEQETADFSYSSTSGTCVLSFKGKAIPGGTESSSSTDVILQCDPHEEGKLESVTDPIQQDDLFQMPLTLRSKYACPVKSGLSTGSILIIVFISLLVVYLVAGILFNKFHKGATGKEVIPNVSFWADFPLLVKDGAVFSYQCCKNICSRKRSSYESI